MTDLQELLDDLAASLERPVSLEDRRWRLIAHSAHDGGTDSVRLASILARAAPPDVAAWLDSLRLDRRTQPVVDVPANADLGMVERVCAPVRHNGTLLGYLWVIEGEQRLSDDQREALATAAGGTGLVLWRRRLNEKELQRAHTETLRALLLDPAAEARREAARALAAQQGWRADARYVVLVAERPPDGPDLPEIAAHARRRWDPGRLVSLAEAGRLVVVALLGPDERAGADAAVKALQDAGAELVAAGAPRADLQSAHEALAEAEATRRTLAAVGRLGATARWDRLGSWAALVEALDRGAPVVPAPIRRVLDEPSGPQLLEALEAALDHADDMTRAAASLNMSRATLYRRLQRVEQASGLRLASGDDRLTLHLGVRLWRLAGG